MAHTLPKLHNAMWPGLVGKGDGEGQEPPISLERMLDLTAAANVNGQKFEGIDYFLFLPHTNPEASDDELKKIADLIASKGFTVGSLVAPVWPGTVGDSAMGDDAQQEKFLSAVKMACRIAGIFNKHGVRKYGVIRIDSAEFGVDQVARESEGEHRAHRGHLQEGREDRRGSRRASRRRRRDLLGGHALVEGHARRARRRRHAGGARLPGRPRAHLSLHCSATTPPSTRC